MLKIADFLDLNKRKSVSVKIYEKSNPLVIVSRLLNLKIQLKIFSQQRLSSLMSTVKTQLKKLSFCKDINTIYYGWLGTGSFGECLSFKRWSLVRDLV